MYFIPRKFRIGKTMLVLSLIPSKTFAGIIWWFKPQIRRNINGNPNITQYCFGVGFLSVRPVGVDE